MSTSEGLRPIESIRRDDLVWAYDLVASQWRLCRVTKPYNLRYKGVSIFTMIAGDTIESTFQHPYWVVRGESLASRPWLEHLEAIPAGATMPGRWVDSCDLRVGDEVVLRDGRIMPVERTWHGPFDGTVYNMEVDDLHCYTVGRIRVLVHNNNGLGTGPVQPAPNSNINITQKGLNHVLDRHVPGGISSSGKSVFSAGENVPALVQQGDSVAATQQAGGNFQRIVDAGRNIGIDRATGQATSIYTIITNAAGDLVTAFPGLP